MASADYTSRLLAFVVQKQAHLNLEHEAAVAHACLSECVGVDLPHERFSVEVAGLADSGVVEPARAGASHLVLTRDGLALAEVLSESLQQADRRRITNLLLQYQKTPVEQRANFCQELLESLPSEDFAPVRRADPVDPSTLSVGGVPVHVSASPSRCHIGTYRLIGRDRLRFSVTAARVCTNAIQEIDEPKRIWVTGWANQDDTVTLVSSGGLPETIPFYNAHLALETYAEDAPLPAERHEFIRTEVFFTALSKGIKRSGWWRHRGRGIIFYNYGLRTRESVKGFSWTRVPAFRVEVLETTRTEDFVLVADPTHFHSVSLGAWIESGLSVAEVHALAVQDEEYPFDAMPSFDLCRPRVPAHLKALSSGEDVLEVEMRYGRDRFETVRAADLAIRRDVLDAIAPGAPRPPSVLSPVERIAALRDWARDVLPRRVEAGGFTFEIGVKETPLNEIARKGDAWRLQPPRLLFNEKRQRDETTSDPRALFRYGPNSGPRTVALRAIVVPKDLGREDAFAFVDAVREAYAGLHLGELDTSGMSVIAYPGARVREASKGLQSLHSAAEGAHEVVLVVLRNDTREVYGTAKDLVATVTGRPAQCCGISTARKIVSGSYATAKGLALQTYLKTLRREEAPWLLGDVTSPKKTLFIGIGYSKQPESGEDQVSHASLSLADGVRPDWRPMGFSMRPRRYFDRPTAAAFVRFVEAEVARHPDLERVVVLRRGDVYPAERAAIAAEAAAREANWELDFVGITDANVRIFANADEPTNPDAGLLYLVSDDRCLLSLSSLPGERVAAGSVRLLELTRAVGSTPIADLGREIYDQAFLCWGSPARPPKGPMPLDLAEKVAELALQTSREEVFEFFPL